MLTGGHSQLSLKGYGVQRMFLRTARKQKSYFQGGSSKLRAGQPHLQSWGGDEQINPGTISFRYRVK